MSATSPANRMTWGLRVPMDRGTGWAAGRINRSPPTSPPPNSVRMSATAWRSAPTGLG